MLQRQRSAHLTRAGRSENLDRLLSRIARRPHLDADRVREMALERSFSFARCSPEEALSRRGSAAHYPAVAVVDGSHHAVSGGRTAAYAREMGGSISALEAARAKLQRARQDLTTLDQDVARFFGSEPYRIEVQFDTDSGWYIAYLRIQTEPPAALSVHVGAMAHQCYSALNHVVWKLVVRKIGLRRAEQNRMRIAFPLCATPDHFNESVVAKNVSRAARNLLESMQPYHRNTRHPLALLKELADADKHRVLAPSYGVGHLSDVLDGSALSWDESAAVDPVLERIIPISRNPFKVPANPINDGDTLVRVRFGSGNDRAKLVVREQPTVGLIFESDSVGIPLEQLRSFVDTAEVCLARLAMLFPRESWPPLDPHAAP